MLNKCWIERLSSAEHLPDCTVKQQLVNTCLTLNHEPWLDRKGPSPGTGHEEGPSIGGPRSGQCAAGVCAGASAGPGVSAGSRVGTGTGGPEAPSVPPGPGVCLYRERVQVLTVKKRRTANYGATAIGSAKGSRSALPRGEMDDDQQEDVTARVESRASEGRAGELKTWEAELHEYSRSLAEDGWQVWKKGAVASIMTEMQRRVMPDAWRDEVRRASERVASLEEAVARGSEKESGLLRKIQELESGPGCARELREDIERMSTRLNHQQLRERQRHVLAEMITVAADRKAGASLRGSAVEVTDEAGSNPELRTQHAELRRQVVELKAELESSQARAWARVWVGGRGPGQGPGQGSGTGSGPGPGPGPGFVAAPPTARPLDLSTRGSTTPGARARACRQART